MVYNRLDSKTEVTGYKLMFKCNDEYYCIPDQLDYYLTERFYYLEGESYEIPESMPLQMCKTGYHFYRNAKDILNNMIYPITSETVMFVVKGSKEILESYVTGEEKLCARKIEIVRELTDEEMYKALQANNQQRLLCSTNVDSISKYVSGSNAVTQSRDVSESVSVFNSKGVFRSFNVRYSGGIISSRDIHKSEKIISSELVSESENVISSVNVNNSEDIKSTAHASLSRQIRDSEYICTSHNLVHCRHLDSSMCCHNIQFGKYMFFNKKISEERYKEINSNYIHMMNVNCERLCNDIKPNNWHMIVRINDSYNRFYITEDLKLWLMKFKEYDEAIFNALFTVKNRINRDKF
jgi:hypothetical protein